MNTLTGQIGSEGALVDVQIGLAAADVQALRQAGKAVPLPISARAMLDTGAEATCVDPQVLAPLVASGLTMTRLVLVNIPAAGNLKMTIEYAVSVTVIHPSGKPRANLVLRSLPVVEQSFGSLSFQVLLGRDLLDLGVLVYDGPGRAFTLAY